ncbi:MAG TPA: hypothetical protein DCG47_10540 [Spirochaetaceae bacterium]|nr:hypothetical protein [Spirochaetaceae bacterium]
MTLAVHLDQVQLPIEQAILLGLIVGELVSNSMKHAFFGQDHGTIHISPRDNSGICTIEVKYDG